MKPDPLAGLHDIHLPAPISWWPSAPGWWLLTLLILLMTTGLLWWLRRRKKQQREVKYFSQSEMIAQALNEMDRLDQLAAADDDARDLAVELSGLLRRVAIHLDTERNEHHNEPKNSLGNDHEKEPKNIAGLSGNAWLAWLDERWENDAFSHGVGRQLLDAPFQPKGAVDISMLLQLARAWLKAQQ